MKQCFGYVRVSTVKQGDGVSLEAQQEAITDFAKNNNINITKWFEETVTAAKTGRPLFDAMIKALKKGGAVGIVFHKIDRSARNSRDWADIIDLHEAGYHIHFAHESFDFNSRGGRLAADIQAVVASDYIRNLREESIKGQRGRLKQGLYPYAAPVGYLNNGKGKPKTIDPVKGPLVLKLFQLYATGEYSYKSLAPIMREAHLRNVSGGFISKTGIEHILSNPFYTGLIRIKQTGETYVGQHEALIPIELFDQATAIRTGRRRKVKVMHDYLYRGLFQCAFCERALVGERQRGRVYYRCHRRECPSKSIREDRITETLESHISKLTFTPADIKKLEKSLYSWLKQKNASVEVAKAPLEIAEVEKRISRLTDKFIDDHIDKSVFDQKKTELLTEKLRLTQIMEGNIEEYRRKIDYLLEHLKTVSLRHKIMTSALKRELIKFACSNISIDPQNPCFTTPKWHFELKRYVSDLASPLAADPTRTLEEIKKLE